ncbi:serine hydrolase domain-containing protein [Providencia alcalifaciens]|uniref:serine hydrolase domain-containing protein n=1 Tax=Providencia alcalifaciens TaxID=126385 RepID=UPI001CC57900|nr:serine hydrolase domain-containing protein [Providencia alcalifaciens]CAG9407351.1 Penicillin-binding protein 4* [Providencia alcalifaciens]
MGISASRENIIFNNTKQKLLAWEQQFNTDGPGFTYMAKFDQGKSYSGSLGFADLEKKEALTVDTIFNLASVSKQFTAFSILLLEQNGKLSLNDPITKYIPELPEYTNGITIQDLIYHISGMVDYIELALDKGRGYFDALGPEESLADLIAFPNPIYPIGTQFDYCNTGYFLLSIMIERISGQSYREFAQQYIFEPLQMNSTFIVDSYPVHTVIARGYRSNPECGYQLSESLWTQTGDGAIHSNVLDLMKWGENYTTGKVGGKTLITKMLQALPPKNIAGDAIEHHESYAYGVIISQHFGITHFEHSGGWAGCTTYFLRIPDLGLTVAVLGNTEDLDTQKMAYDITDIMLAHSKELHDHHD